MLNGSEFLPAAQRRPAVRGCCALWIDGRDTVEPICYIVGACHPGQLYLAPRREAFVIAADQGLRYLEAAGITPDLIVGDFDSLGTVPQGTNVIRHPVEKDDTDMMLAVKTGLARGYRTFVLYGGIGGRLDHTYANFQALTYLARHGAVGYLVGEDSVAAAVAEGELRFSAELRGWIGVFCPDGEARGVDIDGLYYSLRDGTLTSGFPLGASNHFTGREASVSVKEGTLLVMWQERADSLVRRL